MTTAALTPARAAARPLLAALGISLPGQGLGGSSAVGLVATRWQRSEPLPEPA